MDSEKRQFTILYDDVLDSTAYRCLSDGAARRLVEFVRRWNYETRNGRETSVRNIRFSWSNTSGLVWRNTWSLHRQELIEKGFISPVNARAGLYSMSDAWRGYQPSSAEHGRMLRQQEEQERRHAATMEKQGDDSYCELGKNTAQLDKESLGKNSAHLLGRKSAPPPGAENLPTKHMKYKYNLPLPPPPASTSHSDALPTRTISEHGARLQVWPPTETVMSGQWAFLAWARDVSGHWNDAERHAAEALLSGFERDSKHKTGHDALAQTRENLRSTGDETAFIMALAEALGKANAMSINRVRKVYNAHGPDAVVSAVRSMLEEPNMSPVMRLKYLEFRAKAFDVERAI